MSFDYQFITIAITVLVHAATSIWWASKINTTLDFQRDILKNINDALKLYEYTKYSKEEAAKDFLIRDQQVSAIWKKIDYLLAKE